jgi:hypothetical protein
VPISPDNKHKSNPFSFWLSNLDHFLLQTPRKSK